MKTVRAIVLAAALALAGCGGFLSDKDKLDIANDANLIARCQLEGASCKLDAGADAGRAQRQVCFDQYDACLRDAGLR